jgi:ATP-binding cassette, subfamily B, bacterial MsbA
VSLPRFFLRYFRRYALWGVLAGVGIVLYAAATTSLVVLIEPIFGEVLLAGDQVPGGLGLVAGAVGGHHAAADATPAGAGTEEAGAEAAASPPAAKATPLPAPARRLLEKLDLKDHLYASYLALKRRLGIGPDQVVYFVPLLLVILFLIRSVADFTSGYAFQHIGLGVTTDVRNDLYFNILNQSSRFHSSHTSGELMTRVVSDVALMQNAVSNRLLDLFQQSFTLVALLLLLLSTNFRLALICLVAAPALVYPIVRFGKGMRRTSHRSQERLADLTSLLAEAVRGHRVVKAFGMERFEFDRFRRATRRHLRVNLWAQMLANLAGPVVESLAVVGSAALLVYAGRAIRSGHLTAPALISFLANLLLMYDPVRKLNKVNLILQQALAAAQRVQRIMGVPNEIAERPEALALTEVEQGLAYEGVVFAYDHQPVLRGIDLSIRSGEIVALVGSSGAGKSTLVNLLPRFFDPDEGRVAIDGHDIRDLTLASLRALIGIVTQETVLFDDTVRGNIAYGRSDLPLELVREAAAAAYADEFIMELPAGYETVIGESGLRLSGGQRQRLAIARALLKNAPILVLDEATSQLDSESEALVQKALYNLMQGRTTLVIAHRLSTVMKADRIVVMEAGRVVEAGTHRELLSLGGTYKRLYDLQFRT